ncbi:hypothetical protein M5689_017683 [Euphorbia peplus]|nr:hypothetical protein M5689_017683 [Euphorbia peplus]
MKKNYTKLQKKYAQDGEKTVDWLKTLFDAEATANPENTLYLQDIVRMAELFETAFREWNEFRTTPDNKPLDTVSSCESCLDEVDVEPDKYCLVGDKKEDKQVRVCGGGTLKAMALGMSVGVLIGMGLSLASFVMVSLSEYDFSGDMGLTPT